MEGKKIYEESYKELQNISHHSSGESIVINFTKLDSATSGAIREALTKTINKRLNEISSIICGVD